ncbi:extracellular solute-binding protein, partial [Acinetobacter baumannii]|nr:extracellular solute-binding protein [Acinetobacter baumannii]
MAHPNWKRGLAGLGIAGLTIGAMAGCSSGGGDGASGEDVTITVALAANPQMQTAESLIADCEEKNPGIHVEFTVLPENELRPAVTKDVSTNAGQYDVAMIGSYEVPIWA